LVMKNSGGIWITTNTAITINTIRFTLDLRHRIKSPLP
jgi:hypothetical protein